MIFEVFDKSGRLIYLTRERWTHILRHPEMVNQLENIKDAFKKPDKILLFRNQVRFYFRYVKQRKEYLFISVKYLNGKGFVITSFYTDKIK